MQTFWGLIIPFIGTTLGAAMVFLMKNKMNKKIEKLLLGFASRSNDSCINMVTNNTFN